jgi:hypothetical protein
MKARDRTSKEFFHKRAKQAEDDDAYCASCGADLASQHATKAKRAPKRKDDPGTQRV